MAYFTLLWLRVFVALWLEMVWLDVKLHNLTDQNASSWPHAATVTSKHLVNANPCVVGEFYSDRQRI